MKICYQGETGDSDLRTIISGNILHVSLWDVLAILERENKSLNEINPQQSRMNIINGIMETMDIEEYIHVPSNNPELPEEVFVTQPGLYRILSADRSKAGKKFQKWLFHEVVPSIAQYGSYPPPIKPSGSVLAQMAEILAQNSRMLADAIVRQDRLENEVNNVKTKLDHVEDRVSAIEADGLDTKLIITVKDRFQQRSIVANPERELEVVAWCENLSLSKGKRRISCPSGDRLSAKYFIEIIDEAIEFVLGSRRLT